MPFAGSTPVLDAQENSTPQPVYPQWGDRGTDPSGASLAPGLVSSWGRVPPLTITVSSSGIQPHQQHETHENTL
jgi:hypothetical protein